MIRRALASGKRRVRGWLRRAPAPRALILLYHRVGEVGVDPWALTVTPDRLAGHLACLQDQYRVVRLDELPERLRGPRERRLVAITFDDGYRDVLTLAAPLLDRAGASATVFVTTGRLDSDEEYWWDALARIALGDHALPPAIELDVAGRPVRMTLTAVAPTGMHAPADAAPNDQWRAWDPPPGPRQTLYRDLYALLLPLPDGERWRILHVLHAWAGVPIQARPSHRILTAADLRELARRDHVEIGAHTITHPVLSGQSAAEQQEEIAGSRRLLEHATDRPVRSFAYPYGRPEHYTRETVALVRRAGFARACVNVPGLVGEDTDRLLLPRLLVQDWDQEEFARRLRAIW
jgi:peptidoglycan/xylan/chitin deacetylase (PgdA/CDA1 family)